MSRRVRTLLRRTSRLVVLAVAGVFCLFPLFPGLVAATPSDWNDPGIYPKPPTPPLPPAGGLLIDPTFGNPILRVTDPKVEPVRIDVNSNPNKSMFNADGTRFYLREIDAPRNWSLYGVDKATFTVTRLTTLPRTTADGKAIRQDGAIWHPIEPNLLYTNVSTNHTLYELNVSTGQLSPLVDFSSVLPGAGFTGPMDVDQTTGRYYAMMASSIPNGGQDQYDEVAVWDRQTGLFTTLNTFQTYGFYNHSMEMDASGQFVYLGPPGGPFYFWEWQTNTLRQITNQARGHFMMGYGVMVNHYEGDYVIRSTSTPDQPTLLFSIPRKNGVLDSYEDRHGSRILADGRTFINHFVTVTHRADADADWRPMMDEIFEVQTQGTLAGSWKRLAHHRQILTVNDTFTDAPRANADPTGSFVLFKSNWDKTLSRSDVFLLKVPTDTTSSTDTTPPSVSISSPTSGSTVAGTVTVVVSATDTGGVTKIDYSLDGSMMASFSPPVMTVLWDTKTAPNGSHALTVTATDAAGHSANASVSLTVLNADTTPPTVSITAPLAGAVVKTSSTVTIAATASDNVGVTKVEFYVNGSLKCSLASSPYACAWKVPSSLGQTYQLQAKAYDARGNVGSSTVTVTSGLFASAKKKGK